MAKKLKRKSPDAEYIRALFEPHRFIINHGEVKKREARLITSLKSSRLYAKVEKDIIKQNIDISVEIANNF
tara:strand:- start:858 stop:1070 length:213 start_codon:yes stop_codon:yes gene_type:complete